MGTLLLRLAGPVQSWGYESKFETRRTSREPTKSGVTGMLAAALGRRRNESVDDINALRFGVRIDREGDIIKDYHTARYVSPDIEDYHIAKYVSPKKGIKVTYRYYLSDAVFLVGLESGNQEFLETLKHAVLNPVFPLYLGRRSCMPTLPIVIGIRDENLTDALSKEPLQLTEWMKREEEKRGSNIIRMVLDAQPSDKDAATRKDLAVSFDPRDRQYSYRLVTEQILIKNKELTDTTHDAMAEISR